MIAVQKKRKDAEDEFINRGNAENGQTFSEQERPTDESQGTVGQEQQMMKHKKKNGKAAEVKQWSAESIHRQGVLSRLQVGIR